MRNRKNFFTYLCYILFVLCTLIYIAAYTGVFDSFNTVQAVSGVVFVAVIMFMTAFICYLLSVIMHRRKIPEKLNYLDTSHKRYEYVIETILIVFVFLSAAGIRVFGKYQGIFSKDTDIFNETFIINTLFFLAGAIFMYFSIRFTGGRFAALIGTALMSFWPSGIMAVYLNTTTELITNMVLWGLFLWFVLFFKGYNKKGKNKKIIYICIILLGAASNLVLLSSDYAFLFILSIFAFMLFRYWKPALLYILFALPSLCLKIIGIVTGILNGKTDEFYDLLDFNITISDINLLKFSHYFFDLNTLLYLTIYIFALVTVIILFRQSKKTFQIFMLYAVFASFLGKENFIYVISVYIFLAAYLVQLMYSFMVKRRCIKYSRQIHNEDTAATSEYEDVTEPEPPEMVEDIAEPEPPEMVEDIAEPEPPETVEDIAEPEPPEDMETPDTDINDIIPRAVTENDYRINTNEDYKQIIHNEIIEMIERRKQRLNKKSGDNNTVD